MFPVQTKCRASAKALASLLLGAALTLSSCADVRVPGQRDVDIPTYKSAEERKPGVNERPDAITYLPLGDDVLVPEAESGSPLPSTVVGPFELRNESLAGALQLVLDGVNIPIAFETANAGGTITVTNLHGPLDAVVTQICGLADLYCSYQNGILVVKDNQVFTVTIPPIVAQDQIGTLLTNIATAVGNIVNSTTITDPSTRTIVYRASQRTSEMAERYFQRLRTNTALVVFETYIWEVGLNSGNSTGIRWQAFDQFGKFNVGLNMVGSVVPTLGTPISIGLPTTGAVDFDTSDIVQFISSYGAVKTISQPQLTVLSGSSARLRIADTQNYVASISRTTTDGGTSTVSTTTDSVDSGFTLEISSNWDNASVYSNINILLQEVQGIDTFDDNPEAVVQLPQTTERELQTQVRIRPGDSLLIAGLVRENDQFDKAGPGIRAPIFPTSRAAQTANSELVFLLKPRVIVFTSKNAQPNAARQMTAVAPAAVAPVPVPPPVSIPPEAVPVAPAPLPPVSQTQSIAPQPAPVEMEPMDDLPPLPAAVPVPAPAPVMPPQTVTEKPSSANGDPSVMIDYNLLQGRP